MRLYLVSQIVLVGALHIFGSSANAAADDFPRPDVPTVAAAEADSSGLPVPAESGDVGDHYNYYGHPTCCEPNCETYRRLDALFNRCEWVCPSDDCFSNFISPITNPFWFEDPRTLTEIKPTILHQATPATAGRGHINTLTMPIRLAISDRLSFIVAKNGFVMPNADLDEDIRDGWLDTSLGLKYNLMKDYSQQRILSTGFTFEIPAATPRHFKAMATARSTCSLRTGPSLVPAIGSAARVLCCL